MFFPKNPKLCGAEFAGHCMPDITNKTRVVALCGITDLQGHAAPGSDGWFMSDFYLFNHLLRDAPVASQSWFTCCEPRDLVKTYTRYSHGNPFRERRVVLDQQRLDAIYASGTLRVTAPNALLDRFLATVKEECRTAVKNDQAVLLLIFGHGDASTYGVTIGSSDVKKFSERTAPKLSIKHLKVAIGKRAQCTLLMTSCYSGGWAMRPDLNLTVIAAAGPTQESQSWTKSSTLRYSGSIVASAICEAIIETEVQDAESKEDPEDDQDSVDQMTYAAMGDLIHDYLKTNDRLYDRHQISFAAQDDELERLWRARTGLPLSFFKQRWEELSAIPAQPDAFTNRDPASTFGDYSSLPSPTTAGSRTGSSMPLRPTMTRQQVYNLTRSWAAGYMDSFPGEPNMSKNASLHTLVEDLLSGEDRYDSEDQLEDLLILGSTLKYRLDSMAHATDYKDILGIDYVDCNACPVEGWINPLSESKEPDAKAKLHKYDFIYSLVNDARLFSEPLDGQGWAYSKPQKYLAIVLVESRTSDEEIKEALKTLKTSKSFISASCAIPQLTATTVRTEYLAPKIDEVRRGRWFRDTAAQLLKPVQKTLRSISPQRKRRSIVTSY